MPGKRKLSSEAKMLIRGHALRVARKKHPGAAIEVLVGDYIDENSRVEQTVRIVPNEGGN